MQRLLMLPIFPFEAPIDTIVSVPGSKSLSNRALVVASLAAGKSRLSNVLHSDDTRYMIAHLRTLGISLQASDDEVEIEGLGGHFQPVQATLFCGNAGTTVRFLTAFCSLVPGAQVVTGDQRMQTRPIYDLVDALTGLGVDIECVNGCPPVTVRSAVLPGGRVQVQANLSSQYLSAILMVAPYAQQAISLEAAGEMVSETYVELTLEVMAAFGVAVERPDRRRFHIPQQCYQGRNFAIEVSRVLVGAGCVDRGSRHGAKYPTLVASRGHGAVAHPGAHGMYDHATARGDGAGTRQAEKPGGRRYESPPRWGHDPGSAGRVGAG
jgi:3-phosphoshikimate 1-carboxyvinyltransferase